MSLKNKEKIRRSFTELVEPVDDAVSIDMETRLLMFRFLSEVEKITEERGITRKELAKMIGTSPSFITQLYRGTKIVNLATLAKLQKALNFRFRIEAVGSFPEGSIKNIPKKDLQRYGLVAG